MLWIRKKRVTHLIRGISSKENNTTVVLLCQLEDAMIEFSNYKIENGEYFCVGITIVTSDWFSFNKVC
jgi:hypothetical protein